jgi:hypothetical protein
MTDENQEELQSKEYKPQRIFQHINKHLRSVAVSANLLSADT